MWIHRASSKIGEEENSIFMAQYWMLPRTEVRIFLRTEIRIFLFDDPPGRWMPIPIL